MDKNSKAADEMSRVPDGVSLCHQCGRTRAVLCLFTSTGLGTPGQGSAPFCSSDSAEKYVLLPGYHNLNTLDVEKGFLLVGSYDPVQDQTLKNCVCVCVLILFRIS